MASTYSTSLKLELIGNGDQSGTWGSTTNNNLGTLLEQAITGVTTITMVNADYVLTNFNGTSDEARNAVLVIGGTNSAIRQVIAPLVQKLYVISNQTSGGYAITIGATTGTTVTIPNGITAQVYCDGTNFYSSQTGSAGDFTVNGSFYATGNESVTGNMTVGGTLAVTGTSAFTGAVALNGGGTSTTPTAGDNSTKIATTAFVSTATGGLGTMSTQNANNVSITGGTIVGITDLAVADGGTGASTFTANSVVLGNGTSALNGNLVAPGTSGNLLTSNGTTWTSAAPAAVAGAAVAWVRFNGVTNTIYASYNVSSITKNSTGDYTLNFTNALADTNYAILGSSNSASYSNNGGQCASLKCTAVNGTPALLTTTQVEILVGTSGSVNDATYISVAIFR